MTSVHDEDKGTRCNNKGEQVNLKEVQCNSKGGYVNIKEA